MPRLMPTHWCARTSISGTYRAHSVRPRSCLLVPSQRFKTMHEGRHSALVCVPLLFDHPHAGPAWVDASRNDGHRARRARQGLDRHGIVEGALNASPRDMRELAQRPTASTMSGATHVLLRKIIVCVHVVLLNNVAFDQEPGWNLHRAAACLCVRSARRCGSPGCHGRGCDSLL